jgi:protein-S-isoprenylcysteine O-methyltransferase Ste14
MTWSAFNGFARYALLACWCGLTLVFIVRRRGMRRASSKHAPAARWGMALQGVSIAGAWAPRGESYFVPALGPVVQTVASALGLVLGISSVWLVVEAVRVLGEHWSIQARLIEGHRLIVAGPYSHVRNPIYTGMLGMLVATGLVFSVWWVLLPALAFFAVGTAIRIRAEEALLAGAFGEDFDAYRNHIPAIIPRWRSHPD